jgi:hypothetical protein
MIRFVDFNVNETVRVKLTERGLQTLRERHDEIARQYPAFGSFKPPKTDADGWSEFQLWSLMRSLGPHILMGGPTLFETTIQIGLPA